MGVLTIELGPLPTRIQLQCRQPLGSSDQPFGGLQSFVDAHQVGHGTGLLARRPGAEDRQLNELMAFADVLEQTSAFEAGHRGCDARLHYPEEPVRSRRRTCGFRLTDHRGLMSTG
ncbi:hypothetical protein [Piscinibacter sp.]|uniref:hypothetical protein n=1 Tax=Piscinibacter sp. TaxID=1903157 RepID=UPI002F3F91FB